MYKGDNVDSEKDKAMYGEWICTNLTATTLFLIRWLLGDRDGFASGGSDDIIGWFKGFVGNDTIYFCATE